MSESICSILNLCYGTECRDLDFIPGKDVIGRPAWIYILDVEKAPLFIHVKGRYGNSWYRDVFMGYYVPIDANAMEIQSFYDSLGAEYNKKCEYMSDVYEALSRIIQELNLSKKIDILDFMGGAGGLSYLLYYLGYSNIDLIDNSNKLIEISQKRPINIHYIKANCLDYTFDKKYDLIVCSLGLHHLSVDSKLKVLKKIKNNLKEDGVFISLENDIFVPYNLFFTNLQFQNVTIDSLQYGEIHYIATVCRL